MTGEGDILIFLGDIDEKESLAISDLFAFDDDWDNWFSIYRNLRDDKLIGLFWSSFPVQHMYGNSAVTTALVPVVWTGFSGF